MVLPGLLEPPCGLSSLPQLEFLSRDFARAYWMPSGRLYAWSHHASGMGQSGVGQVRETSGSMAQLRSLGLLVASHIPHTPLRLRYINRRWSIWYEKNETGHNRAKSRQTRQAYAKTDCFRFST